MSTIRWYLDEDAMAHALVQSLRARSLDVLTVNEADMAGKPDDVQLDFAARHGRVLYTFNVGDFCRLHAEYLDSGRSHAGIVVVARQRYTIGRQVRGILALTAGTSAEEMRGALVFLNVPS